MIKLLSPVSILSTVLICNEVCHKLAELGKLENSLDLSTRTVFEPSPKLTESIIGPCERPLRLMTKGFLCKNDSSTYTVMLKGAAVSLRWTMFFKHRV